MANKTATLKNQAGDNIYPNIVGDNRNAAIKDSTTIKHTLAENKISLDLDEVIKGKIDAALQKPTGLTKTKLVGVGTNGQENIEIGDNLTLANGKLSATGGGSGGIEINILIGTITGGTDIDLTGTYTGIFDKEKINLLFLADLDNAFIQITSFFGLDDNFTGKAWILMDGSIFDINITNGTLEIKLIPTTYYNHFVTMTNLTDNVAIYLSIQNIDNSLFNANRLTSYLAGKKILANGNLHGVVPTYIAGEGGVIKIYYRTPGDSNINPTPDEYQDLSSFTISDLVTPVALLE